MVQLLAFGNYFHFLFFSYAAISRSLDSNNSYKAYVETYARDFPRGPVAKTRSSQFRGTGLDPWSGN